MGNRRGNSTLDIAARGKGSHAQVSITGRKFASEQNNTTTVIRADAALTTTYVYSNPIDVSTDSKVHLLIEITNAAAGDIASIIPEVCAHEDSEKFYPLSEQSAATTVTVATLASDAEYSSVAEFASKIFRPLEIRNDSIVAGSIKLWVTLDVPFARLFRVGCAAAAGTPNLKITAARST